MRKTMITERHESTPPSSDDVDREEMLWGTRQELQINKWKEEAANKAIHHTKRQNRYKMFYNALMLPLVILPCISSAITMQVSERVNVFLFLATGILNGVHGFLNYGRRQQEHGDYSNLWEAFVTDIESEMCKPKRSRVACDVFLQKTLDQFQKLSATEPS